MPVRIETPRLTLRPLVVEEDLDDLVALDNDPAVMEFLNGGRPASRAEVERDYRGCLARGAHYAAFERSIDEFVGWFAFSQIPDADPGSYSLGYRLRQEAWGRGYATEGSRALIDLGFEQLGVRRVSAETMAVNTRSRRVMEKSGLSHVRTFHLEWDDPLPGTELGEVEYALTWDEWDEGRGGAPSAPPRVSPRGGLVTLRRHGSGGADRTVRLSGGGGAGPGPHGPLPVQPEGDLPQGADLERL